MGMGTDRLSTARMASGEVYEIGGMVTFAKGSMVSRTLVENNAGTIALFACDVGQNLDIHGTCDSLAAQSAKKPIKK